MGEVYKNKRGDTLVRIFDQPSPKPLTGEYLDHMGLFHTDTHVVFEIAAIKELPKPVTYKGKEYSKIRNIEVHRGLKLNEPCPVCGSHYPNPRCPNKGMYPAVQAFLAHEHQKVIGWIGSFLNAEHFSYCASINWTGGKIPKDEVIDPMSKERVPFPVRKAALDKFRGTTA